MLTTPDNLLFLHLLRDDMQNELLRHLSRDGGEADWPVVPWVHLEVQHNPTFKQSKPKPFPNLVLNLQMKTTASN